MNSDTIKGDTRTTHSFLSRIGFQLLIPYLMISFVSLFIVSGLIYFAYSIEIASIHEINKNVAEHASAQIDAYIKLITEEVDFVSSILLCETCDDHLIEEYILEKLLIRDPSIFRVIIFDPEFNILYSEGSISETDASELFKEQYLSSFRSALNESEFISPVYMSGHELPTIQIAHTILSTDNQIRGVVIVEVDLSPMWNTISKIHVGENGYAYVINEEGGLVMYRDTTIINENRDLRSIPIVREFLEQEHTTEVYTSFTGSVVYGHIQSIPSTGWGAIVELPQSEVRERFIPLIIISIVAALLFIGSTALMISVLFRKVLNPLEQLRLGVQELNSGTLSHSIQVKVNNELGELALAFNMMSQSIEESYATLDDKVKERTHALEKSEHALKKEKEQIERLNEFMVDRELKMIELKRKIKTSQEGGDVPKNDNS